MAAYDVPEQLVKRLKLSGRQIKELKKAFLLYDKNRDGFILMEEYECLAQSLGVSQRCNSCSSPTGSDPIGRHSLDPSHGTGRIDFVQFLQLITQSARRRFSYQLESDLMEAFQRVDSSKKGYLTASDLKLMMKGLGDCSVSDADVMEMMMEADLNKDSHICYEEFRQMMSRPLNDQR